MEKKKMADCRVGTSGYQYKHWKSVFYPPEMPGEERFQFYSSQFDTVEINNTFYNLPGADIFEKWHRQAPDGFRYSLKFSRYGTHMKKLRDPDTYTGNFIERAERLKSYLGPILLQLPPGWKANAERLKNFLKVSPRRHKWALEFRDKTWLCDEIYEILRSQGAALCIHDMLEDHPRILTTDWTYLRFHGNNYSGSYSRQSLTAWAEWIKDKLAEGTDVYAYFNNDAHGYAVQNAFALRRYVGG